MKQIFPSIALLIFALPAYGEDARIAIATASGQSAPVTLTAPVCGVDSSGAPVLCGGGGNGNLAYKDVSGQYQTILPVVPVCSVTADGVPQTCDFSGGTADLSAYLTAAVAATTYVPQSQLGANGGVATLDADGNVTAPINTTGTANTGALTVTSTTGTVQGSVSGTTKKWTLSRRSQDTYTILNSYTGSKWAPFTFNDDGTMDSTVGVFANLGADAPFTGALSAASLKISGVSELSGNLALDNGKAMTFHGPSGSTAASVYLYGTSDGKIGASGPMAIPTLSVSTAAYVPDTTTSDSTTAALNTESAAARFIDKETVAATYQTIQDMNVYVRSISGDLTNPVISGATLSGATSIDGGKITTDGSGNLSVAGSLTAPTPSTGDSSTNAATTAFVQNTLNAERGSVTGDLSASGSSLTATLGASGLQFVMSYSSAGTGSLSAVSTSGTLTPVDIYETAAWGTTSFKGFTLDSGTITTTAKVIDSTFYLTSNAWGTYHVGVGGSLYVVDIFGAGAGKRTVIAWRKES